jgi:solute carrier family 35 protein F5
MSDKHAEDAVMSRLSYQAYLRAEEERQRLGNKLSIKQVVKLAIFFCLLVSPHFSGSSMRTCV